MDNEKNFIDVEFYDNDDDKEIRGEPLYYNTIQVAQILGENDSTIRYWTKYFDDILKITISNKMKRYKKDDIEKLKFIRKLIREDGFTLKQVVEYCTEKGFDIEKGTIDNNNPLAIQSFISAMTVHMDDEILSMQNKIIKAQEDMFKHMLEIQKENNELIKEQIALKVDEVVSEKMDYYFNKIDSRELDKTNEMNEKLDNIKQLMEERKKESENDKKKSWIKKIFNYK